MEQKSMTALISAFARAYHYKNNSVRIFNDSIAEKILSKEEYEQICTNMKMGIGFFNPTFSGSDKEALRWIVDNQLSPSPLGRAIYTETMLENAVSIGAQQYVIWGAGYDTFAYRKPSFADIIKIFEIDHPLTSKDKQKRLEENQIKKPNNTYYIESDFCSFDKNQVLSNPNFDIEKISFHSLLGISYYLDEDDFSNIIKDISDISCKGSSIIFDYPDKYTFTEKAGSRTKKQLMLAQKSGETMKASYSYEELEKLLSKSGFLIYEHLTPTNITKTYFEEYNLKNPNNIITAFDNVNYCLAVKK